MKDLLLKEWLLSEQMEQYVAPFEVEDMQMSDAVDRNSRSTSVISERGVRHWKGGNREF